MRLGSPEFEQRLSARVRAELQASPSLCAEHRRAFAARRISFWTVLVYVICFWMAPIVVGGFPLALLVALPYGVGGADLVLGVAGLVQLCGAFFFAAWLLRALYRGPTRSTLGCLPLSDAGIVRTAWRQVLPYSLVFLYLAMLAYGAVVLMARFGPAGWVLAAMLVVLQWPVTVAVGTILVAVRPGWPYLATAICASILTVGSPILIAVARLTGWDATPLLMATPGGWIGAVLAWGHRDNIGIAWLFLLPVALLIVSGMRAMRRLQSWYTAGETASVAPGDQDQNVAPAGGRGAMWIRPALRAWAAWSSDVLPVAAAPCLTVEEAERLIRTRKFLAPQSWASNGWIERLVRRWLTPRECVVVDFMTDDRFVWETTLRWCMLVYVVLAVLAILAPLGILRLPLYLFLLLCTSGVALIPIPWPGFRLNGRPGVRVPQYIVFPLGFREIAVALLKTSLVRASVVSPLVILAGAAGAWDLENDVLPTVIWGVELTFLAILFPAWWVVLSFCNGMSDPNLRLLPRRMFATAVALALGGIGGVSLMGVGLFQSLPADFQGGRPQSAVAAWICAVVGALVHAGCLFGFWRICARLHSQSLIDLSPGPSALRLESHDEVSQSLSRGDRYSALRRTYGPWRWLRQAYWMERRQIV